MWVYTGITSVGGDESNLGFILVNQRTKEARYYACAGANEQAGMNWHRERCSSIAIRRPSRSF